MDNNKLRDEIMVLDTAEVASRLGIKHRESINQLIKSKKFPNAFKEKKQWRIPIEDVRQYEKSLPSHDTSGCLDTRQAAERLGYKAPFSIIQLIEKSILPNAFQIKKKWWIPLADIEAVEKMRAENLDVKKVAQILGVNPAKVTEMIRNHVFSNSFNDVLGVLRVPYKDIEEYQIKKEEERKEMEKSIESSVSTLEAAKILGYKTTSTVLLYLNNGYFPTAFKVGTGWRIPLTDLKRLQMNLYEIKKELSEKKFSIKENQQIQNCLDVNQLSEILQLSRKNILSLIQKGAFGNALKFKRKYWIHEDILDEYQREKEEQKGFNQNNLTTQDAAKRLNYKHNGTVSLLIGEGKFPNAFKKDGSWRIPVSDIQEFEEARAIKSKKISYTPEIAYKELKESLENIVHDENLPETKKLYLQYCLLQINNTNGSTRYKRDRILLYKRLYEKLAATIKNEIYVLPQDDIANLLGAKSPIRKDEKKVLIRFVKYVYNQMGIEVNQEFNVNTVRKNNREKEVYSPEEFHGLYKYVRGLNTHTANAIKDRFYSNMWVYSILLLTDFIRGQDLIINTPSIDLESVNIDSLYWFNENKISEFQGQSVINQLYTHFRYKRTSKTDELLTFIVAPNLVLPLATALCISELHRRYEDSDTLLDTFMEGTFNTVRTAGKKRHQQFFNGLNRFADFRFSSQKLNRSVATYLFYSVTEEDGQDSDLALHLTQVSRSHKSPDTTSQYIQATNKDGSINRVSYNLFKRGHFGWLYNYLILYVSRFQGMQDTLEQRSNLIEQVRNELSPFELESVAKFVNNSLSPIPSKKQSFNIEDFIKDIYKKRQSVISKLTDFSQKKQRRLYPS
ncbi:helix-turn-helix domain-containing protein [Sporosarcina koreensis]|uniref:helix-turn-helix domain-containing protein n=1 Tax=Sporosarcina koreensis TaxID=334735 RepID=UPI0007547D04|nr:helix-turn-helix domain-containing protein [Sporosarcina koreensis]